MYFDKIEIRQEVPQITKRSKAETENRQKWKVIHYELEHDREPEQFPPHSLGFWCFDRAVGVEQAFVRLKQDMIDRRHKLVLELLTEINELNELEYKVKK